MSRADREAYNEYMRKYMKERYKRVIGKAIGKLGGKCVSCGASEALEFDHIDRRAKRFEITDGHSRSAKDFWAEVDKCQLLCRTCHIAKTSEENGVPHGGGASGKRNCLCDPCRERKALYMAIYKIAND